MRCGYFVIKIGYSNREGITFRKFRRKIIDGTSFIMDLVQLWIENFGKYYPASERYVSYILYTRNPTE